MLSVGAMARSLNASPEVLYSHPPQSSHASGNRPPIVFSLFSRHQKLLFIDPESSNSYKRGHNRSRRPRGGEFIWRSAMIAPVLPTYNRAPVAFDHGKGCASIPRWVRNTSTSARASQSRALAMHIRISWRR